MLAVPDGCSFLSVFHEFIGNVPTTLPKVRCYGNVGPRPGANTALDKSWPYDYDVSYHNPGLVQPHKTHPEFWLPLCNLITGAAIQDVGSLTSGSEYALDNGTSKITTPVTFHLRGCRQVLLLCATGAAATGLTKGILAGTFEK